MRNYISKILKITCSDKSQEVKLIQSLWSGYGEIVKVRLIGGPIKSVVAKHIVLPKQINHPRGWNTNNSHQRKVKSYQVEINWYKYWSAQCDESCKVPKCYGIEDQGEEQLIILEDLDCKGYPERKTHLKIEEVKVCLKWLANFHGQFMNKPPDRLWEIGTYWHLATRPDELAAMNDNELKVAAWKIDELLNNCKYQTFVHGDAKVANFCFSNDLKNVAVVDFQYVGGGCGIKDVVYLLGSCLTELECEIHENELLDYYFEELELALDKNGNQLNFKELKDEWAGLYAFAWTDFTRFLMGWMPTHQKVNDYSKKLVEKTLANI